MDSSSSSSTARASRATSRSAATATSTTATPAGSIRMTIAERRAHTMQAIKTASVSSRNLPACSEPRASRRPTSPARRANAVPRAPMDTLPAPVPAADADRTDRHEEMISALQLQMSEDKAAQELKIEQLQQQMADDKAIQELKIAQLQLQMADQKRAFESKLVDQKTQQELKIADQELKIAHLQQQVVDSEREHLEQLVVVADSVTTVENSLFGAREEMLHLHRLNAKKLRHLDKQMKAQAANKCDCREQLAVVAASVTTVENSLFSAKDELLRLRDIDALKLSYLNGRVKSQVTSIQANARALRQSIAALKEDMKTKNDLSAVRHCSDPTEQLKQSLPSSCVRAGPCDLEVNSVVTSSCFSIVISSLDSAAVVNTSDVSERSTEPMTDTPPSFSKISESEADHEAYSSDASTTDSLSSSDDDMDLTRVQLRSANTRFKN